VEAAQPRPKGQEDHSQSSNSPATTLDLTNSHGRLADPTSLSSGLSPNAPSVQLQSWPAPPLTGGVSSAARQEFCFLGDQPCRPVLPVPVQAFESLRQFRREYLLFPYRKSISHRTAAGPFNHRLRSSFCSAWNAACFGAPPSGVTARPRTEHAASHRGAQSRLAGLDGLLPTHRGKERVGGTRWLAQAQAADAALAAMETRLYTGSESNEGRVRQGAGVAIGRQRTWSMVERRRAALEPRLSQILVRPHGLVSLLDTIAPPTRCARRKQA